MARSRTKKLTARDAQEIVEVLSQAPPEVRAQALALLAQDLPNISPRLRGDIARDLAASFAPSATKSAPAKGRSKPRKTAKKSARKSARKTARKSTRKTARKSTRKTARKSAKKTTRQKLKERRAPRRQKLNKVHRDLLDSALDIRKSGPGYVADVWRANKFHTTGEMLSREQALKDPRFVEAYKYTKRSKAGKKRRIKAWMELGFSENEAEWIDEYFSTGK